MAYIGQDPVIGRYIIVDQISGGFNGTASGFTLAAGGQGVIPGLAQNVLLSLGGVIQQPGTDYTVSGSGITFTTPPLSGTTFFATVLGDVQAVGTPSDGTVLPASIATSGTFVFPNITTTGTTLIASGNASTPSLAVIGDTNTGLYSPGADQLSITTGGTERFRIDNAGQLEAVSLGTAAAPTFSFTTDPNTGIYSPGADQLAISTNGTGRLFVDASGRVGVGLGELQYRQDHVNFRHRVGYISVSAGGVSERLRITSAGLVGIGTSSPTGKLDVNIGTSSSQGIVVQSGNDAAVTGDHILVTSARGSTSAYNLIKAQNSTGVKFLVSGSGNVGIGTTSPSRLLTLYDAGTLTYLQLAHSGASGTSRGLELVLNSNEANIINREAGGLFLSTAGGPITFSSAGERARIDSSGRLLVGTSTVLGTSTLVVQGIPSVTNPGIYLSRASNASTIVDGNTLGFIEYGSQDNGLGAQIVAVADGTWSSTSDCPTRLVFSTTADGAASPTERMRIDSAGNVMIDSTSVSQTSDTGVKYQASPVCWNIVVDSATGTTSHLHLYNVNATNNGFRFYVNSNGGIANFQANNVNLSDRNAKKDIIPAADTWNCLKEWEIVNYRYKDQPDDAALNLGVIAQQVAESCPEVITVFQEAKEAIEDKPAQEERLGVKEQQMYWMAIKALQEAQVRIEALEADVAQLKGA
jgi:hypothetical protein